MVSLVYVHACTIGCPYINFTVLVNAEMVDHTAFLAPDVYCSATNNKLRPMSINGKSV